MYDLVVIGSGPGGYVGAIRAAQLGLKVALVEKYSSVGGTCLNVGCIPSKALLTSSEHYSFSQHHLKNHGIDVKSVNLNLDQMMKRKQDVVKNLTQGISFLIKKNNITRFLGRGSLESPHEVKVTDEKGKSQILNAKNILLATGSKPQELSFLPFDKKQIISSTQALELSQVPSKIIIIGAGVIGVELGSVWNRLGSEVHILEISDTICSGMDKEASLGLKKSLENQGLNFHLKVSLLKDIKKSAKSITLSYQEDTSVKKITADLVLVSIGRKPYYEGLGLESLNITQDERGRVEVNSHFQTSSHSHIYAIGDLIRGPMLAHKAEEEGVAVAEIISGQQGEVNYETCPSVVYTHPELASVGKTEEELKEQNRGYKKGVFPFKANGRAQSMAETEGFVKMLSCEKTDRLLGVHILGPRASDILSEAVVAMEFEGSAEDLARSFHSHPTLTETLKEAALQTYDKVARHM